MGGEGWGTRPVLGTVPVRALCAPPQENETNMPTSQGALHTPGAGAAAAGLALG